jgi:hypothetical protein
MPDLRHDVTQCRWLCSLAIAVLVQRNQKIDVFVTAQYEGAGLHRIGGQHDRLASSAGGQQDRLCCRATGKDETRQNSGSDPVHHAPRLQSYLWAS